MARKLVGRKEAVSVLLKILANYEHIEKYMDAGDKRRLEDMVHCIEAELENYHEWGGDASEVVVLHWPHDSRQILEMERDELFDIYRKYRFIPSDNDKLEAQLQIQQMLDIINNLRNPKDE